MAPPLNNLHPRRLCPPILLLYVAAWVIFRRRCHVAEKLLTFDEVAEHFGVSRATVRAWAYKREIATVRVGHRTTRISPQAVAAFEQRRTKTARRSA